MGCEDIGILYSRGRAVEGSVAACCATYAKARVCDYCFDFAKLAGLIPRNSSELEVVSV